MCGICGIWNHKNINNLENRTAAMIAAMVHRGPDDLGQFLDHQVALGMRRLAIIDTSVTGKQPMCSSDEKIWIVFNGEIFNFQSERKQLQESGYPFYSNSDTEVILRLYEKYGDDFLSHLRGMFAIAIYDRRKGSGNERLLLARDPLGIKPLLYTKTGDTFVFGSEMKALLASGLISREIDPNSLRQLLTYGSVYQPNTMLNDVKMLPPAHKMVFEQQSVRQEPYWSFDVNRMPDLQTSPYSNLVDRLADLLQETVKLHMISDVPVGAFLSGGVDSSLLVGLMANLAGKRIKTYSVGFEGEGSEIDETSDARKTADFLGTDHTQVIITGEDVRKEILNIAAGLDQPTVDGVNSYFISKAARSTVTVAISGTGGDEIFAGYPWFTSMAMYADRFKIHQLGYWLENTKSNVLSNPLLDRFFVSDIGKSHQHLRSRYGFLARFAETYQIFGSAWAARLIAKPLQHAAHAGRAMAWETRPNDQLKNEHAINRTSALVMRGYLCNQLLRDIDVASMSQSLEVRVPYLDTKMIDFALSLPISSKHGIIAPIENPSTASYHQTGSKRILIDAGKKLGILRADIDQQPKRGFAMPFDPWLKGPLQDTLKDCLSPETIKARGLLDLGEVAQIQRSFQAHAVGWTHPWLLMMLELWCRTVLDA